MTYYSIKDRAYTTLASGIVPNATVAWLTSGGVFPSTNCVLSIENEQFYAASRSGNVVDISGGQFGTSVASHAIAVAVALNLNTAVVGQIQSGVVALESVSGLAKVTAVTSNGIHSVTQSTATIETTIHEDTDTGTYDLSVYLDFSAMGSAAQGGTITCRLHNKVDEANYREVAKAEFIAGADTTYPSFEVGMLHHNTKITVQCGTAITSNYSVPWYYMKKDLD